MSDKSSWTQTFWSMRTTARQAKHSRARQLGEDLWNSGLGVLSTLVLQELCVSVRRKARGPLSVEETRRLVEDYFNWEAVINTPASVTQALELEARYKFSFWDALILQAAETAGVAILYWARFVPRSMQIVAGR